MSVEQLGLRIMLSCNVIRRTYPFSIIMLSIKEVTRVNSFQMKQCTLISEVIDTPIPFLELHALKTEAFVLERNN
jgi:hypothetical protein